MRLEQALGATDGLVSVVGAGGKEIDAVYVGVSS